MVELDRPTANRNIFPEVKPATEPLKFPDGTSPPELTPGLQMIFGVIAKAQKGGKPASDADIQEQWPKSLPPLTKHNLHSAISKLRQAIKNNPWTIDNTARDKGPRAKGNWMFVQSKDKPEIHALNVPVSEIPKKISPLPHKQKLGVVTGPDGKIISVKPAEPKISTAIGKLPEDKKKTDFDNATLDLIREKTLPKIGDEISKAMLELIIDAAKRNETPRKEDLEKLFEQSGIKDRKTIWELIRRHSGMIRPALREIGLTIEPTDDDLETGIGDHPTKISFRLTKIKPPNPKLLLSIEDIESAPVINDPTQQNKERITSKIQKEDSPELTELKIDLALSVLKLLSLSKLDMLEKNPYNLLDKFFGEKEIKTMVGGRKKQEYAKFLVNLVMETVGRLMGETKIARNTPISEEEDKVKRILTEKEIQIADILNELTLKGVGIVDVRKAISEHFGIGPENATSSPEPVSPKAEAPSSKPPKRKWSKYI